MRRTLLAWLVAGILAILGVMPFLTGSARLIRAPLTRIYGPVVLVVPLWSALFLALSLVLAFVLVASALRFASIARPLLILVAGAWILHATGFWRIGLPVDRLLGAESLGDLFRLTARNLHEDWLIGGPQMGWIILVVVIVLAVAAEIILSRQARPGGRGRMFAATFSLLGIVALVLSSCGEAQTPPQKYPVSIPVADVVGFTVVLADQVDTETPGPLPGGDILAQFLDAYSRSPANEFVPTPGDLVAVVIWRKDGEVTEVLAGPGYPESHVLARYTDAQRGISGRAQLSSAMLVDLIKELARERLSAADQRQLDPEGVWLGG